MEKKSTLVTCSMIAGALLSVSAVKASNSLLNYNALGTASEVRTALVKTIEANCGEKKADGKTDTKAKDGKAKDGKCGEGKCGEKKDAKKSDGKAKDGKCGEGKCGEKKSEKKPH
ncbi:MAG: HvfA family oxazolone/thioamide-modified RiPP metallophore [Bacteroidia bacterium]